MNCPFYQDGGCQKSRFFLIKSLNCINFYFQCAFSVSIHSIVLPKIPRINFPGCPFLCTEEWVVYLPNLNKPTDAFKQFQIIGNRNKTENIVYQKNGFPKKLKNSFLKTNSIQLRIHNFFFFQNYFPLLN